MSFHNTAPYFLAFYRSDHYINPYSLFKFKIFALITTFYIALCNYVCMTTIAVITGYSFKNM